MEGAAGAADKRDRKKDAYPPCFISMVCGPSGPSTPTILRQNSPSNSLPTLCLRAAAAQGRSGGVRKGRS